MNRILLKAPGCAVYITHEWLVKLPAGPVENTPKIYPFILKINYLSEGTLGIIGVIQIGAIIKTDQERRKDREECPA